ncbi:hypothetical protein Lesp02_50830 [Lentzea sp. NBRC 105346]|uniref:SagB family peptide dehydrogenase n=1 Tax=Lentzea sp. NBRC 105346 TaxID=3032205 RepID=UPI0024A2C352|nr:SagB family peptide dehydrogenase [Lentzea sp. NBRC 105346]GLZ32895.1 hypothetical protein Lesp02_50830 [Lentzea sp. NBRC 105346]
MNSISLHPRTRFAAGPGGKTLVGHPWGVHAIQGDFSRLRRLTEEPVDPATLDAETLRFLATFPFLVVHHVGDVLRLVPLGIDAAPVEPCADDMPIKLSRFALLRNDDGVLVLESPLSLYRAELSPELGRTVTALVQPKTLSSFDNVERQVVRELVSAGLVGNVEDLSTWDFHDLLFHTRSRAGRHDQPVGAQYRGEEPPRFKTVAGEPIPLATPAAVDVPFTTVLERRRSTRSYGPEGMTVEELGGLLHHAARIKDGRRPYPSAGASYDLELYLAVRRCRGLDTGVYHYDPLAHALRLVREELGELARRPADFDSPPDVLVVITSRFGRVSWKYTSIAYALTLRNVGVLCQTLYLVAASMGLAACALGSGDIAGTERLLGVPFTEESTVGEFALGSLGV